MLRVQPANGPWFARHQHARQRDGAVSRSLGESSKVACISRFRKPLVSCTAACTLSSNKGGIFIATSADPDAMPRLEDTKHYTMHSTCIASGIAALPIDGCYVAR